MYSRTEVRLLVTIEFNGDASIQQLHILTSHQWFSARRGLLSKGFLLLLNFQQIDIFWSPICFITFCLLNPHLFRHCTHRWVSSPWLANVCKNRNATKPQKSRLMIQSILTLLILWRYKFDEAIKKPYLGVPTWVFFTSDLTAIRPTVFTNNIFSSFISITIC